MSSRFLSERRSSLSPYTPGEQPKNRKYLKLNTNESPFPPSENVSAAVEKEARKLMLYSDPQSAELTVKVSEYLGVAPENVLMTNGSDEILNFAFMAFGDKEHPFVFPDITYGFYPVFAELNDVPYREIPLKEDFSIDLNDYINAKGNILIANPNAPTGLILRIDDIEKIVASKPRNVVIIDEAYIDFGGKSCIELIKKYDNLLITRTFSKSFSLAGARLGFGIGSAEIISDLNMIKYSTNPYNVNRMTAAAGIAAIESSDYYETNCRTIAKNREFTERELRLRGFKTLESKANFIFATHPNIGGKDLYVKLKEKDILIRHFDKERIKEYNRITIGTEKQMKTLISAIDEVLKTQTV